MVASGCKRSNKQYSDCYCDCYSDCRRTLQVTAVAGAVMITPGLRQFAAPLWGVGAGRKNLLKRLDRGETIGLIPDGINGIFSTDAAGKGDALVLGKKVEWWTHHGRSDTGCILVCGRDPNMLHHDLHREEWFDSRFKPVRFVSRHTS